MNEAEKAHPRSMHTEEIMSSDYVQSEMDRMMLASTRSPTPPYRSFYYSSEESEEEEETGGFEPRIQFNLSRYNDASFWSVGSVDGPFIRATEEREAAYWDSRPPSDPTHALARIILFSFSPTSRAGFRGEKTASTMYAEDMKRKNKGIGAAASAPKKAKKDSAKAKKAFPSWDDLPLGERQIYENMAPQNIPYSFYRVPAVSLPPAEGPDHILTMF